MSRLDRKRVLRLELPGGILQVRHNERALNAGNLCSGGKEQAVIVDSTGISLLADEWSTELKARKPEKPEHKFDTATCTPLLEQSAPKELLPEVIKSDVLLHQLGTARNEIRDVAK